MRVEEDTRSRATIIRNKTGKRNTWASEALRKKWQDPEWRAALLAKRKVIQDDRKRGLYPRWNRSGVWSGYTREEAEKVQKAATEYAKETVRKLMENKVIDENEDPRAIEALEQAIAVMRTPGDKRTTVAAARLVLDFTKAKPAQKQDITVKSAEDWLAAVTSAAKE